MPFKTVRSCLQRAALAASAAVAMALGAVPQAWAGFSLGDLANFAILYTGSSSNSLKITGGSGGSILGNIGIAGSGKLKSTGPETITGNIEFAAAKSSQLSLTNTTVTGTTTYSISQVSTDLTYLNNLSSTLGGEAGTNLSVNLTSGHSMTLNSSTGKLDSSGNRVYQITSFNFASGSTLTINGDGSGHSVVLNFAQDAVFGGTINIGGGLIADQVLFNFTGSNNDVTIAANGATENGVVLDPHGAISMSDTVLLGRLFGGGTKNMVIGASSNLIDPPGNDVPEPPTLALLLAAFAGMGIFARRRLPRRAA